MSAATHIEIAASPEEVRKIFLDFANFSKIKDQLIRSIAPVGKDSITKGSKLLCDFKGLKSEVTVTENSPETFSWRGDALYVLSGDHSFSFLPSRVTPGHTLFVNSEKFGRLMWFLAKVGIVDGDADFTAFNVKFKARVEGLVAGTAQL